MGRVDEGRRWGILREVVDPVGAGIRHGGATLAVTLEVALGGNGRQEEAWARLGGAGSPHNAANGIEARR